MNKSAVALAADSAVTIAVGSKEEKIFDTADKLFELSDRDPIGIMIYNVTSFVEIPLQILIKKFCRECPSCLNVSECATCFLRNLDDVGKNSSESVKDNAIRAMASPVVWQINNQFYSEFRKKTKSSSDGKTEDLFKLMSTTWREVFESFRSVIIKLEDALFIGDGEIIIDNHTGNILESCAIEIFSPSESDKRDTVELLKLVIKKKVPSDRVATMYLTTEARLANQSKDRPALFFLRNLFGSSFGCLWTGWMRMRIGGRFGRVAQVSMKRWRHYVPHGQ